MPERDHLRRLSHIWIRHPIYFLTTCTIDRKKILSCATIASVLSESWLAAPGVHGWVVGRYVIMPDHVHFFARPHADAKPLASFMRDWKKWTTRQLSIQQGIKPPLWQSEFFDHLLRSPRSYSMKWDYVRNNPVRAGLVGNAQSWPYAGECEQLQL